MPSVAIVLATFQGEQYLPALLASIAAQTHTEWTLLVRDDGSSDATLAVLQGFQQQFPHRVRLLSDSLGNLGACRNFGRLLTQVSADYVFLADQDDVWGPHKIQVFLRAAEGAEPSLPALWHSDLQLINAAGEVMAPSFWSFQGLDPDRGSVLVRLLLENCVTGCATMVNRALLQRALPLPDGAIMHDWWLALVAASVGHIHVIKRVTAQYRQHEANVVGAKAWRLAALPQQVWADGLAPMRASLLRKRRQAACLVERLDAVSSTHQAVCVASALVQSADWRKGRRIATAIKHGWRMSTVARTLGLYLVL